MGEAVAIVDSFQARGERGLQLALAAAQAVADNRGKDIQILDLRELTALFDFFVIATGTSQRQLRAMCDGVDDVLRKQMGDRRLSLEGYQDSKWILADYGNVVVHLFDEEGRDYYRLEDLWGSAKRVDLSGKLVGIAQ